MLFRSPVFPSRNQNVQPRPSVSYPHVKPTVTCFKCMEFKDIILVTFSLIQLQPKCHLIMVFWRQLLLDRRYEIFTDKKSLKYIFSQLDLNLHQTRCVDSISDFDLGISHTPCKENVIIDALRRKHSNSNLIL